MKPLRSRLLFVLFFASVAAGGCAANEAPSGAEPSPGIAATVAKAGTASASPATSASGRREELSGEPVEITYFTPPQQEGPYYPVEKPDERDNDLVEVAGAAATPAGEVLLLSGVLYNAGGLPVEGATIEIWQTDSNGIYRHPGDPGTANRDPNFQFYGEAQTGSDGVYSFRTIIPGRYEPRPRHIHVKVRLAGEEVLTTQFYFENEVTFSGPEANLLIKMAQAEDDAGNPIWVGERDVVLNRE
jgi:protocatechuate 3,4-dioxygenase beta subunit